MKKNFLNNQIIKALSIGLSASMAMQPLTALANEGENITDTDENVLEVTDAQEDSAESSEKTYEEAKEAVGDADDAIDTAAEAVDTADEVTSENYEEAKEALEDANRAVEDAEIQVGAAGFTNNEGQEALNEIGVDITIIDDKTQEAEDTYKEAVEAAEVAEKASDSIDVNTTTSEQAEKIVKTVEENVKTAEDKLAEANGKLDEAQSAYDAALEAYEELKRDVDATEISIADAKNDLEIARKALDDAKDQVADAAENVNDEYENIKNSGYQQIIDAQKEISEMTGDEDDYQDKLDALSKLIIKYYILENTEIDEGTGIDFGEDSFSFITDYEKDEDGNYVVDENGNYKPISTPVDVRYVTYTVNGEEVTRKYEYSQTEGVIAVSEKEITLDTEEITLKEEVPESYSTEDGASVYKETETSHVVYIDTEDATKGFYAIDTEDEDSIVSVEDTAPENTKKVKYYEKKGSETKSYDEVVTHTVVDTYKDETVPVEDPKTAGDIVDLSRKVKNYYDEGYDVTVTYKHFWTGEEEVVDINSLGTWKAIKAFFKSLIGINSFSVQAYTTEQVPDETHEEAGIYETVTKTYLVETKKEGKTTYEYKDFVVKKTLYDATDYTKYTAHQDAVTADIHNIYTSSTQIGSTDDEEFEMAVAEQKEALDNADRAKKAADAANTAYLEALEKVKEAQKKVDELESASVSKKDLVAAQYELKIALAELETAEEIKDKAKEVLDDAKEALDDATRKAQEIRNKESDSSDRGSSDDGSNDGESGSSSDGTTGGDTTPAIVVIPTTPAVIPVADQAVVLGEARTPAQRVSAANARSVSASNGNEDGNGNGSDAAIVGAQKEDTKTPESPKNEITIEETKTALAATPELEDKGFAWWWLLILAAIAGVSVEEYARRKRNKAKAEAKNGAEINK